MDREAQGWDANFRLDRGFWLTFAVVGPIALLAVWQWMPADPIVSFAAGCVILPFLATALVYAGWQVFDLCILKEKVSRAQIRALALSLLSLLLLGAIARFTGTLQKSRIASVFFLTFFTTMLYHFLRRYFDERPR